jgi:hypothetical protein
MDNLENSDEGIVEIQCNEGKPDSRERSNDWQTQSAYSKVETAEEGHEYMGNRS